MNTQTKIIDSVVSFKHYHIVFCPNPTEPRLNGYNVEAKSMVEAIKIHQKKHPNIEPLYILHKS